ncbi:hypothetical protein MKW94_007458, partial [Papaver nudicaule]|nr:hypothetical protein [Papaver nudicaule]
AEKLSDEAIAAVQKKFVALNRHYYPGSSLNVQLLVSIYRKQSGLSLDDETEVHTPKIQRTSFRLKARLSEKAKQDSSPAERHGLSPARQYAAKGKRKISPVIDNIGDKSTPSPSRAIDKNRHPLGSTSSSLCL